MKLVVFTIEEANGLVTELRPRIERLIHTKREFDHLQQAIDVLELATAGTAPTNPDVQELGRLQERRRLVAQRITQGVTAIHRRGCLIKDLDRGLVDFYTLAGDRLIFLCWQMGEPEIQHWHSLEAGFSGRQPLHRTELE
ncbi:MAG TPA: DUF2203 domain-containing protein [Candidatus Limnocylindria bacterium]|nr:DUF2203 domain-containing protein [Candidatus Limnocylindria bacterium]